MPSYAKIAKESKVKNPISPKKSKNVKEDFGKDY